MRFKTKVKIFRGKLNAAPLLDVIFLLLILSLISTSYEFQPGLEVNLPKMDALCEFPDIAIGSEAY